MSPKLKSPCMGCHDRILPTKDNPQTCHGNCEREAEYIAIVKKEMDMQLKHRAAEADFITARSAHLRKYFAVKRRKNDKGRL